MIYLLLKGRIGNQLFMYAAARALQMEIGGNQEIVIEDRDNLKENYANSLPYYHLNNVTYTSERNILFSPRFFLQRICLDVCGVLELKMNPAQRHAFEVKHRKIINRCGVFLCENGYMDFPQKYRKDTVMCGYFQSEKFFAKYRDVILKEFSMDRELKGISYPNYEQILKRNTVCISIKVQHNVGSEIYNVCTSKYWEEAIQYIIENVEDPLFFVCSDNVEYVKNNLIDCSRYDVIEQDASFPVHLSLAVMSKCKHFIIGNTSYGWWAQYLSDYQEKIVVAPSKWYLVDIPCEIHQDNWKLVEV